MLAAYTKEQSNPTKPFDILTVSTETSTHEYENDIDWSLLDESSSPYNTLTYCQPLLVYRFRNF
jgi:hypothetical protein